MGENNIWNPSGTFLRMARVTVVCRKNTVAPSSGKFWNFVCKPAVIAAVMQVMLSRCICPNVPAGLIINWLFRSGIAYNTRHEFSSIELHTILSLETMDELVVQVFDI